MYYYYPNSYQVENYFKYCLIFLCVISLTKMGVETGLYCQYQETLHPLNQWTSLQITLIILFDHTLILNKTEIQHTIYALSNWYPGH